MAGSTQRVIRETFLALLEERPLNEITVKLIVERCPGGGEGVGLFENFIDGDGGRAVEDENLRDGGIADGEIAPNLRQEALFCGLADGLQHDLSAAGHDVGDDDQRDIAEQPAMTRADAL